MGKSTLSSFDSKAWKRSRPLVTEIQGLTEMSGVLLSLDVYSEPPTPSPRVTRILVPEKTRVMRKPRNMGNRCIVYTVV